MNTEVLSRPQAPEMTLHTVPHSQEFIDQAFTTIIAEDLAMAGLMDAVMSMQHLNMTQDPALAVEAVASANLSTAYHGEEANTAAFAWSVHPAVIAAENARQHQAFLASYNATSKTEDD